MENIENIRLFIRSLDASTEQLENALEPILKQSLNELISQNVSSNDPIERIKIYNNFTYTLISVLFSYIKSLGINTDTHPIMKELTRIKQFMKRLKDIETNAETSEQRQKVQQEKAKEFLQNALGSRINGGGQAAPNSLASPAISSSNFQGSHTRFTDKDDDDQSDDNSTEKDIVVKKGKPEPKVKAQSIKKSSSNNKKNFKVSKPNKKSKTGSTK
ncbi:uncharacterized protein RJT21DRAFT_40152 [Scheffersomyces amazonensis]|uniref:uncharacterized protein n=1 Tax=Scheffersomyces amazonensis TaxID=1078765 RepID=UPI00315C7365